MPQSRSRMSQSRVSSSALSAEGNDSATFNCDAVLEVLGYIPLWGNGETESNLEPSFGKKEDLQNPSEEDKEERFAKSRRGTPSVLHAMTAGLSAATVAATAAATACRAADLAAAALAGLEGTTADADPGVSPAAATAWALAAGPVSTVVSLLLAGRFKEPSALGVIESS